MPIARRARFGAGMYSMNVFHEICEYWNLARDQIKKIKKKLPS
jgi:hypothetical protein